MLSQHSSYHSGSDVLGQSCISSFLSHDLKTLRVDWVCIQRAPALMTTLEKHRTDLEVVRALHGAGVSVRAYNPLPGQLSGASASGQLGLAGCSYLHLIMRPSEVSLLKLVPSCACIILAYMSFPLFWSLTPTCVECVAASDTYINCNLIFRRLPGTTLQYVVVGTQKPFCAKMQTNCLQMLPSCCKKFCK